MKIFARTYLLIVAVGAAGCILLLLDRSEYDAASAFEGAAECADTTSANCFQLFPGTITYERVTQTSAGEQDQVDVTSRGSLLHLALLPSPSQASLVKVGSSLIVEWYVGSVATVWIAGQGIPTTSNLAARHANVGFIGGALIWLAAVAGGIMLVNRRAAADLAAVRIIPTPDQVRSAAASSTILSGGIVGVQLKPALREAYFLPLGLALTALIAARPFMNPDRRLLAFAADAAVFIPILVRLLLLLRNSRVHVDHDAVGRIDWLGRGRSWPMSHIGDAAIGAGRWAGWAIPTLTLEGVDGTELFTISSLGWRLDEVAAALVGAGVPLVVGRQNTTRVTTRRLVAGLLLLLASLAVLVVSFYPPPPSNS